MEGRTLRVRAPVNYKAEASGTNTPGWLKSKTSTRVFSQEKGKEVSVKPENDKENRVQAQQGKKDSPVSAGAKLAGKGETATIADSKKQAPANKQTSKKDAAAARKSTANAKQDTDKSPAVAAGQSDARQANKASNVVDLLTPNDLIKKSSANRLKQKQAEQTQQESAEEPAEVNAAKTAPAGKKVATRGRNANLQVLEVESKAKRGKRKTASETADKLGKDDAATDAAAAGEPDQDPFLPNRKRSKPSSSAQQASAADDQSKMEAQQQPSTAQADPKEVPGLPGVKHHMPLLPGGTIKDAKPSQADAKPAASESRSQSSRSNHTRQQPLARKAAKAAEVSKPDAQPKQGHAAGMADKPVDKPADRSVAAALQPTLASAGGSQSMQFQRLQEEYAQLQQKYAELKERKIQDLDSMLEEGTAKLAAHNETAVKLAEHWRQEAHRQAAFAQAAGAPAMQAELKQHKEEAQRLKAALLDSEAAVLQKERQIIDMKKQMKEEQRRAEAPLQMDQAVQASPIQHAHLAVQVDPDSFSIESNKEAGIRSPAGIHSTGSEATPAAAVAKKPSLHLEEAKEMCPEGHELSESYRAQGVQSTPSGTPGHVGAGCVQVDSSAKPLVPYPVGISGQGPARQPSKSRLANTQFATAEQGTPSNAGQVHIQSSAKPLVPYPVGISVQPQTHEARRSRFAEESDAAGRPMMTPHPIRDVQNSPQAAEPMAEEEQERSVPAIMLPRAVALAKAAAVPLPTSPAQGTPGQAPARSSGNARAMGSIHKSPSDARLATPDGKHATDAEGTQAMEMDMSLTGSAQVNEAQMLNRNALHALMGLEATPIKAGGFKYIHRDTGLIFEIAPATSDSAGQESDADSGEPELCFNPVSLGKAVEMLPAYLQYEIKFGASQRQTLVSRIMEALGKCKVLQKDVQG